MTILSLYRGFEVIVFSIVTIVTIYSIMNPKELKMSFNIEYSCHTITNIKHGRRLSLQLMTN